MDMPLHAGGEQLLFLLFVLFSIVSALLERRKRKKQREESLEGGPPRRDLLESEEEGEEKSSWPFPMGGDPFELPQPRGRARRGARPRTSEDESRPTEVRGLADPATTADAAPRQTLIEQMEQEQAERAVEVQMASESQRPAMESPQKVVQPRRRVQELVKERMSSEEQRKSRKRSKWALTPQTARDAVVYMEILGPSKANRTDES